MAAERGEVLSRQRQDRAEKHEGTRGMRGYFYLRSQAEAEPAQDSRRAMAPMATHVRAGPLLQRGRAIVVRSRSERPSPLPSPLPLPPLPMPRGTIPPCSAPRFLLLLLLLSPPLSILARPMPGAAPRCFAVACPSNPSNPTQPFPFFAIAGVATLSLRIYRSPLFSSLRCTMPANVAQRPGAILVNRSRLGAFDDTTPCSPRARPVRRLRRLRDALGTVARLPAFSAPP